MLQAKPQPTCVVAFHTTCMNVGGNNIEYMQLVWPRNPSMPHDKPPYTRCARIFAAAAGLISVHACTRLGEVARVGVKPFAGVVL